MTDANTIKFAANLPNGADVFVIQIGSAVTLNAPASNTVSTATIQSGAVTNTQIADDTIAEVKLDIHNAPSGTDKFLAYTSNGMEWVVPADATKMPLAGGSFTGDVVFTGDAANVTWDKSVDDLIFNDNAKAVFGTSSDGLEVFHDGSHSYIKDSGTGELKLQSDFFIVQNAAGNETQLSCDEDGAVSIYYDNVKEFETKSGGVKLNGHSECAVNALGNTNSNPTFDFTVANYITLTLTGNVTVQNPTTESVGQSGSIIITQDGTGSRTCAWSNQFKWTGGTAPTLSTAANAVDRIDYLVVAADTIHCVASLDVK